MKKKGNEPKASIENPATPGIKTDLSDTPRDEARLRPDEATLDLPDVKDIPGQEFIHPPALGELADTTISSDDEEGAGLFDEEQEGEINLRTGTSSDVSAEDRDLLRQAGENMPTGEAEGLRRASLDSRDNEGVPLNEKGMDTARSGRDLDTPGTEQDDRNEAIGEEDEENNSYSLGGDEREADQNNGTVGIP